MKRSEIKFIFVAFFVWRALLYVVLFFAVNYLKLETTFLGGGSGNYLTNPFVWAWGNFDGQHYTYIAQNGYGYAEYTFFPLYPLIIKYLASIFGNSLENLFIIGQIVSNVSFVVGLFGFYKLAKIDYSEKVSKIAVILLLLFPTSYYFAGVYTESLFLALLMWSFYFFRRKNYLSASILGIFLSFLRPIGILVFPAYFLEWVWVNRKQKKIFTKFPYSLFLIPIGLFSYMYYLKGKAGDMLAFFHQQVLFGQHRSTNLILFPQVVYRYLFKVFPNLNWHYFPVVYVTVLEFLIGVVYFVVCLFLFILSPPSYAIFSLLSYLAPTLLGTFASVPRYVVLIFPVYFLLAKYLESKKAALIVFCSLSFILLVISFSLFARGYWIS